MVTQTVFQSLKKMSLVLLAVIASFSAVFFASLYFDKSTKNIFQTPKHFPTSIINSFGNTFFEESVSFSFYQKENMQQVPETFNLENALNPLSLQKFPNAAFSWQKTILKLDTNFTFSAIQKKLILPRSQKLLVSLNEDVFSYIFSAEDSLEFSFSAFDLPTHAKKSRAVFRASSVSQNAQYEESGYFESEFQTESFELSSSALRDLLKPSENASINSETFEENENSLQPTVIPPRSFFVEVQSEFLPAVSFSKIALSKLSILTNFKQEKNSDLQSMQSQLQVNFPFENSEQRERSLNKVAAKVSLLNQFFSQSTEPESKYSFQEQSLRKPLHNCASFTFLTKKEVSKTTVEFPRNYNTFDSYFELRAENENTFSKLQATSKNKDIENNSIQNILKQNWKNDCFVSFSTQGSFESGTTENNSSLSAKPKKSLDPIILTTPYKLEFLKNNSNTTQSTYFLNPTPEITNVKYNLAENTLSESTFSENNLSENTEGDSTISSDRTQKNLEKNQSDLFYVWSSSVIPKLSELLSMAGLPENEFSAFESILPQNFFEVSKLAPKAFSEFQIVLPYLPSRCFAQYTSEMNAPIPQNKMLFATQSTQLEKIDDKYLGTNIEGYRLVVTSIPQFPLLSIGCNAPQEKYSTLRQISEQLIGIYGSNFEGFKTPSQKTSALKLSPNQFMNIPYNIEFSQHMNPGL